MLMVTLYLTEEAKGPENSDRMWSQLMALDFVVLDEHQKAGCIVGEWFGDDIGILERVPGVAALTHRESEPKFTVPPPPKPARAVHKRAA